MTQTEVICNALNYTRFIASRLYDASVNSPAYREQLGEMLETLDAALDQKQPDFFDRHFSGERPTSDKPLCSQCLRRPIAKGEWCADCHARQVLEWDVRIARPNSLARQIPLGVPSAEERLESAQQARAKQSSEVPKSEGPFGRNKHQKKESGAICVECKEREVYARSLCTRCYDRDRKKAKQSMGPMDVVGSQRTTAGVALRGGPGISA